MLKNGVLSAFLQNGAKVGPFLDPETGELNLDPDYTADCLSKQYSSVFSQPRPEWNIPDMKEFFGVDNSRPTGPLLTDLEFTENDIDVCMYGSIQYFCTRA